MVMLLTKSKFFFKNEIFSHHHKDLRCVVVVVEHYEIFCLQ